MAKLFKSSQEVRSAKAVLFSCYNKNMNVDISSLYSPRMLVFLETDPQTNEYYQVLLTKEQYKKVSQHICELIKPADGEGIEEVELNTSEETYLLPDIKDVID